jgi:hypothetical protein
VRGGGDGLVASGGALGYRAGENIDPNDEGATTEQTKGTDAIAPVPISRGATVSSSIPLARRKHYRGRMGQKSKKKRSNVRQVYV